MSLQLIGTVTGGASSPDSPKPGETPKLEATTGDALELVVSLSGDTEKKAPLSEVQWLRDGEDITKELGSVEMVPPDAATSAKATVTVDANRGSFGVYQVVGWAGTANEEKSNEILLVLAGSASSEEAEEQDDTVSEVEVGEWDPRFAYISLAVTSLLAMAILIGAWSVISGITFPASATTSTPDTLIDGSWRDRTASIVFLGAGALGGIVLLIGAWLATVETRGRQRAQKEKRGRGGAVGGLTVPLDPKLIEALASLIDKSRKVRGVIAVVVAGVLLVGFACFGALSVSLDQPQPPVPTQTPAAPSGD